MKHIRITSGAEADLHEIWSFIAVDSIRHADLVADALIDRIILLRTHPHYGRQRKALGPGVRSTAVMRYVIYY